MTGERVETAAERIDRTLTRAILRGDHAPGATLPTVRELAVRFGVNPATVQRAVARLEAKELVVARQGSGLKVLDPRATGGLSLLADWLDATDDQPERSAAILTEMLELRRSATASLLRRHRILVLELIDALDQPFPTGPWPTPADAAAADLAAARAVIETTGSILALTILNSWEQALAGNPALLAAAYDPAHDPGVIQRDVIDILRGGGPRLVQAIDERLAPVDERTVAAYVEALARTAHHRRRRPA